MRALPSLLTLALLAAPLCHATDKPVEAPADPTNLGGSPMPDKQPPVFQLPPGSKPIQAFGFIGSFMRQSFGEDEKAKPPRSPDTTAPAAAPSPAPAGLPQKILAIVERTEKEARAPQVPGGKTPDEAATDGLLALGDELTAATPAQLPPQVLAAARVATAQALNTAGTDSNRRPYTSSLGLAEQVLADEPANRDALNAASGAQYGLGRYPDSVRSASKVLEAHKDDERAYTTRALSYYQMKEYAQAYEDAQSALSLNPNNETAFQISKMAKTRITTASDLGLNAAEKHMAEQVAREYKNAMDEKARAEAAPAARTDPRIADAGAPRPRSDLAVQAAQRFKIQDYRGAREAADKVLAHDPSDADAWQTRAAASSALGEYDAAVGDAGHALALKPDHAEALLTRAQALNQLGRHGEALIDADKAASLRPKDPYAYKARARAHEGLGDLAAMLSDYKQAAKYGPQFDAELREVASKYGVNLASGEAPDGRPAPAPRRRSGMTVVLVCSLIGGLLVAWGLFQAAGGGRGALFTRVSGASTETQKALAAAGGLGAGYEIVRTLGNGGMGVVYEAMDKALERRVAVKKMRDEIRLDERERARFLQEARIVAQLHHPNIVEIHTIVSEGEDLYLVFEFVEGHTVDQIIGRKSRLSLPEAQWVLHGVAKALEYAHGRGVVHRDLKPSNIMMEKDGLVKVMDFGIARQAKDALAKSTMTGTVAGTPQYMAPEQEEGVVRPESDVFSLGAMLYEMLTGQRPYPAPATTASKVNKRYERLSRVRADLPPEVEKLIDDCLEPDPEKRPRTAAEFRKRLDALKESPAAAKQA